MEALLEELKDSSCQEALTQVGELAFEAVITDYEGAPFSGVTVRCSDDVDILGTSDEMGRIAFTIEARGNVACGLVDCATIAFSHPTAMSQEQELDLREAYMRDVTLRRD